MRDRLRGMPVAAVEEQRGHRREGARVCMRRVSVAIRMSVALRVGRGGGFCRKSRWRGKEVLVRVLVLVN